MKKVYFSIMDLTKKKDDPRFETYIEEYNGTDILGYVLRVAEQNKTPLSKLRVFTFESKKQYDACNRAFVQGVDLSKYSDVYTGV